MKNRLQFNRMPKLYASREEATAALELHYRDSSFIPLIGEPIVVRYYDADGNKQAILAIGKATGQTSEDKLHREYHIIDTAEINENVSAASFNAETALELASAATKDVANYLIILKNMIGEDGIDMEDGSYFDTDDPSRCGLYKPLENSNYLDDAKNFREADKILDEAIGGVSDDLDELSATTASLSGTAQEYFNNIIEAAGLTTGEAGKYPGHSDTEYINGATSLDNADVLLDNAISELSGNTIAAITETNNTISELSAVTASLSANTMAADQVLDNKINELSANTMAADQVLDNKINEFSANTVAADQALDSKINELSANTVAADEALDDKIDELSANTIAADDALDDKIDQLSAGTIAADQELADRIAELEGNKILGVSAITVTELDNGDSRVSLVINEEDDKILSQNALGLKAKVTLDYVSADKKIYLKGKDDVVISEIDATNFIKDGMLSAASVFTATEADHEQYPELVVGKTYIKLVFNEAGQDVPGRAHPVFISAEDLVDIYTVAPDSYTYMTIDDYVISLNVDEEDGLASYNYARSISALTGELSGATYNVIQNILEGTGLNNLGPGEYHPHGDTHYIGGAHSLDEADILLDAAIAETSGLVTDISNRIDTLSSVTREFSANTFYTFKELSGAVKDLSAVTESFSAHTVEILSGITNGVGELSAVTESFSSNTYNTFIELSGAVINLSSVTESFSANTVEALSAITVNVDELSAATESFSAHTIEALSAINVNLEVLSGVVIDNEEVTAAALNDLNRRINELSGGTGEGLEALSASVVNNVNNISTISGDVSVLSATVIDNELVTSAALNDLNGKLNTLCGDTYENFTSLSGDVTALSASVVNNVTNISVISGDVAVLSGVVIDNEEVTAAALNDLNNRIIDNDEDIADLYEKLENVSAKTSGVLTVSLNGAEQGKYSPSANTTIGLQITGENVHLPNYAISTGSTEAELKIVPTDSVNQAFGKIEKKANDINARVTELSGITGDYYNELNQKINNLTVSGASEQDLLALSGAVINLSSSTVSIKNEVDECFDGAEYDSTNKRINFKHGNTVKAYIDATAFIKDGMVENVAISGGNLVITFNTDAGKQPISIPLTDIFNPNNYYTKTEINSISGGIVTNLNALSAGTIAVNNRVTSLSAGTIQLSADTVAAIANAINSLDSTISASTGKYFTALGMENGMLVAKQEADIPVLTLESAGTGNVVSQITVNGHKISYQTASVATSEGISQLSGAVINLSAATTAISQNLTNLSGATTAISQNLTNLSAGTVAIKNDVTALSASVVTNKNNITNLSAATTAISQNVTNLSAGTVAIKNDVTALSASVVTNKNNITNLSAATTAISQNLTNLSAGTVGIKTDLTALSASVVTNKTNITALSAGTVQGLTYLSGVIEDNELVIAAAFNDLNDRIREISGSSTDLSNYYTKPEVENLISGALEDMELVIAAALNDLNDRIIELSGNTPDMSNYYTKSEVNNYVSGATLRKYQTASTLTNLAFNEFLTIVKINGSTTLSIASTGLPVLPANGVAERHLIIENTGSTDAVVTITTDSRIKLTMNNLIAIDRNGGIGELNALITYDGSAYTIYVITT